MARVWMGPGRSVAVAVALLALPSAGRAQGWIEPPPGVEGFAVERVRSDVAVRVEGRVAVVEVSEWFLNRGGRVAEGQYLYPLPGEAVFQGFSLFQGDQELRGEIMDAGQARAIYEEIVRRRADPALIELAGEGLLRARVFPIEPGEERKVTLRYTQVLDRAGDALHFRYAGAVRGGAGPEGPATKTRFVLEAPAGSAFLDPFSPTHPVTVRREGGRLSVALAGEPQGRLSLFLPLARERVGLSLATHRPAGEDGYFMLTLSPGRDPGRAEPRDVTVVLDVSGSMSGEKMEQARGALHALLSSLSPEDRFRLVAFSSAVRLEREGWARAGGSDLSQARRWVDGLAADGGTNLEGALREAFRLGSSRERLPVVVFLTDGLPSVGEQDPARLADRAAAEAGRARVFAFGVGHDVNTHLLDRLGEAGRGSTEYVLPGEDVERAVGLLAAKVSHPVLTELEIAGAPVRLTEIHPVHLPDLFAGEELILFGRYRGEGQGAVRIRGERAGRTETFTAEADFPRRDDANGFIPRLWASRKLGHLTRQTWTEGETPGLVEEIRALALRYGLPSPYTSYLVQEPDRVAVDGPALDVGPPRGGVLPGRVPGQGRAPTPSPSTAVGAQAVQAAEQARRMREASSVAKLADAEEELEVRLRAGGMAGGVRAVAGRIFREEDGVWTDAGVREDMARVRVRAFSPAYFDLLGALEELRPVAAALNPVRVAGSEVALEFGEDGVERLSPRELAALARRFRGPR